MDKHFNEINKPSEKPKVIINDNHSKVNENIENQIKTSKPEDSVHDLVKTIANYPELKPISDFLNSANKIFERANQVPPEHKEALKDTIKHLQNDPDTGHVWRAMFKN